MTARELILKIATLGLLAGLAVAGLVLQKPGTEGEATGIGARATGETLWVCPGLYPRAGRSERIAITNPSAEWVSGRITVHAAGRALAARDLDLAPLSSLSVDVGEEISPQAAPAEITAALSAGFFAVIELGTDRPSVVSSLRQSVGPITDVAVARCGRGVARKLAVPGGTSVRGASTYAFLADPLAHDAVVDASLRTETGIEAPSRLRKLPVLASSQSVVKTSDEARRKWVLGLSLEASSGELDASAEVHSDGTRVGAGIARAERVREESSVWIFPSFLEGSGERSVISVINPLDESRSIEVRVFPDRSLGGDATAVVAPAPAVFEIRGKEALTFTPSPALGDGARYGLVIRSKDDGPILASAMTWQEAPKRGLGLVIGESHSSTRWVLPDPTALAIEPGASLEVGVLNATDKPARVQISSFQAGAVGPLPGVEPFAVPSGRTATVDLGPVRQPSESRALLVESDVPVAVQARIAVSGEGNSWAFDTFMLSPAAESESPSPLRALSRSPLSRSLLTSPISSFGGERRLAWSMGLLGTANRRGWSLWLLGAIVIVSAGVVTLLERRGRRGPTPDARSSVEDLGLDRSELRRVVAELVASDSGYPGGPPRLGSEGPGDSRTADSGSALALPPVGSEGPIVLLFSHSDCRACASARELLQSASRSVGFRFFELTHESRPEVFEAVGVEDVPTSVVLDSRGELRAVKTGPIDYAWLSDAISDGIAEAKNSYGDAPFSYEG